MVTNRQIFSGNFFATINLILYTKPTLDIRFGKIDGVRFGHIFNFVIVRGVEAKAPVYLLATMANLINEIWRIDCKLK